MTRSDYLDTSNTNRLKAFFMFCDCANSARDGLANLKIEDPRMRAMTASVIESMRQRAEQEAVNVLSGKSLFVEIAEILNSE